MKSYIIRILISLLSVFIPTKKGLFIFGSWFGKKYGDNSRAMFEYLSQDKKGDIYWFTRNKDVASRIIKDGNKCLYLSGIRCIILHLRAEAVFCNCSANADLMGDFLNRKTKVFNLWHGTPMKKIGKDAINDNISCDRLGISKGNLVFSLLRKVTPKWIYSFFKLDTYYLASSEVVSGLLQSAMELKKEKIIVCGYPKLDKCFEEKDKSNFNILYAPTYRGDYNSELDILSMFGFDVNQAENILKSYNAKLTIRLHPANRLPEDLVREINAKSYILIDTVEDVYDTLHTYSLVITDFSSIYFDALAIGIKALVAPFGYQEYVNNDRGLYFPVNEIYPGKMPYDWGCFFNNFSYYITMENVDLASVRNKFYSYPYCPSSPELSKLIFRILNKGPGNEPVC